MYIVALAWLYVAVLMAVTEPNWVAGTLSFLAYGLGPLALFLWLAGTPVRRARSAEQAIDDVVGTDDRADAQSDQKDLGEGRGELGALVQPRDEVGDRDVDHAGRG